ncbi:MAG: hypothetical protein LC631_02610, partial [Desulfovibrionales bacterium]|nr:hypothetical protein [Desulfovibrionales bacterium]
KKLPDILALLKTLLTEKETGLQWLEVFIRYIVSARQEEDLSAKNIVEIAEQSISKETGEYVMTLLEKLRSEGVPRIYSVLPEIIDKSPTFNYSRQHYGNYNFNNFGVYG